MSQEEVWIEMGVYPEDYSVPIFPPEAKKAGIDAIEEGVKLIAIFASIFGGIFLFLVMCS